MQEIPPMMRPFVLAAAISLALAACNGQAPEAGTPAATDQPTAEADVTPAAAENPLLTASTLPFQAPPFDKIEDADFLPAFEEGMKQHLAEVRKIADNPEPATFDKDRQSTRLNSRHYCALRLPSSTCTKKYTY